MSKRSSRRQFLGTLGATLTAAACSKKPSTSSSGPSGGPQTGSKPPEGPLPGAPKEGEIKLPANASMPMRELGKTGVKVSLLGLGGYHIGVPKDEQEGIRIIRTALDHGVTFLDNCWDYHDGDSERRMGKALKDGYRDKAFLMTKIDARTKDAALLQLDQSLARLGTDVIDLVQIHEVIRMEDAERVFGSKGSIEALQAAKAAGKIRFIGFTGHKDPAIHLHMLQTALDEGFHFDTVQMPLNVMDPHFSSFEQKVLPVLVERGIGVLGMKPMGSGVILESKAVSARECLHYAMSLPTSVVITGCDSVGVLEQALEAAFTSSTFGEKDRSSLLARTEPYGREGKYEQFKTSSRFDGTAKNPKWLETATL